jgi:hypothetical protein
MKHKSPNTMRLCRGMRTGANRCKLNLWGEVGFEPTKKAPRRTGVFPNAAQKAAQGGSLATAARMTCTT